MLLCFDVVRHENDPERKRVETAWYGSVLPQPGHLLKEVEGMLVEKHDAHAYNTESLATDESFWVAKCSCGWESALRPGPVAREEARHHGHRGLLATKRVKVSGHVLGVVWSNESRVQLAVLGEVHE